MTVFGAQADRLVDTGYRVYRSVVPIQGLLDANPHIEKSHLQSRLWMGDNKVRVTTMSHCVTVPGLKV